MEVSNEVITEIVSKLQTTTSKLDELSNKVQVQTNELKTYNKLMQAKTHKEVRAAAVQLTLNLQVGCAFAVHKTPVRDAVLVELLNGSGTIPELEERSGQSSIRPCLIKLIEMGVVEKTEKVYSLK